MIRVTVELVPNGDEKRARKMGRMEIVNQSWGDSRWPVEADYAVQVVTDIGDAASVQQRMVYDHNRLRWNVWGLILSALESLGTEALLYVGDERALGAGEATG